MLSLQQGIEIKESVFLKIQVNSVEDTFWIFWKDKGDYGQGSLF